MDIYNQNPKKIMRKNSKNSLQNMVLRKLKYGREIGAGTENPTKLPYRHLSEIKFIIPIMKL